MTNSNWAPAIEVNEKGCVDAEKTKMLKFWGLVRIMLRGRESLWGIVKK